MSPAGAVPRIALDRIARVQAGSVASSLLSVPGAVAAGSVGLTPISEVMGCTVVHVGWQGYSGCGYWGNGYAIGAGSAMPTRTTFAGFQPYTDAIRGGYTTALARMEGEAALLGADGVIDVRISVSTVGESTFEFLALGTAVRLGAGRARPDHPVVPTELFVTQLPGADVAKLMQAGWLPLTIVYGIALAIRHDDWQTIAQTRGWLNNEVAGYTQLTTSVRAQARKLATAQAATRGADGVLITGSNLRVWEQEVSEGHRDHVAEAQLFGTSVVRFGRPERSAPQPPLSFLPLSKRSTQHRKGHS